MNNPNEYIKEYLNKLILRFVYVRSIYQELTNVTASATGEKSDAVKKIGLNFYNLALYSFRRIIIIELCKLLHDRDKKSLLDCLRKIKCHAKAMDASVYQPDPGVRGERRSLNEEELIKITDNQLKKINEHQAVIDKLLARRDKEIAHIDPSFFNNPEKINEFYPLNDLDLDPLFKTTSEILRKQYSLLFHADMKMELYIPKHMGVDAILQHVYAAMNIWKDRKKFFDAGIDISKYF